MYQPRQSGHLSTGRKSRRSTAFQKVFNGVLSFLLGKTDGLVTAATPG